MKEFNFALIFDFHNPKIDPDIYSDALYEVGCSDGLFAVGKKGSIAIDFIRESESAYEAVSSAIKQVKFVIPESDLVYISPDLVGIKDLAEIFECSQKKIEKYTLKESFPNAFYSVSQSLWYLEDVLNWFKKHTDLTIDSSVEEIAKLARIINLELNKKNKSPQIIKQAQELVTI
ncbi:DNA-binding protein [Geminocystis sp. CENA526]|uniref:DNA-binding protein n=1 Tax=Geminocystis sp. CENA526 TaxID=1355871 RepID=UPI003D6F7C71